MNLLRYRKRILAVFSLLTVLLLGACGGGDSEPAPVPPTPSPSVRPLSQEFFSRKAVSYSGFRGADRATVPTAAEVLEDLQLLVKGNFRLIRLFDSSDAFARLTLQVIKDNKLDIKVQLGIWISGPKASQDSNNMAEIERGIALAKSFSDIVLAVSVGNETMVDWSGLQVPPADMAAYIAYVRERVSQPVTTDDNWAFFANNQDKYQTAIVLKTLDFVSMHTYPLADSLYSLYDWKQTGVDASQRAAAMMDASIAKAKADYNAVTAYLAKSGFSLPVIIGETGWKSSPTQGETGRAHPVNQKMYFDRLAAWTNGPKAIFYFEAFDEPWKGGDDGWGLFDVQRKAKYVVYGLYPDNREPTDYAGSDAVYFIPAVANPTITASNYTVFADTVPAGAAVPAGPVSPATSWNAWDNPATATGTIISGAADEGSTALEITPVPKDWGWGFFLGLGNPEDLTIFNSASGTLNFSIRTSYPGKLEIGFFTGTTAASTGVDVYLAIAPGQYGYVNDGAWHRVSIPVAAIAAKAAPAFGQPASATLDMAAVSNAFVIADRYAVTSNPTRSVAKIAIDNIYWAK